MLSYQHGFHAGGFADVLKHTILGLLLEYMTKKEKPLFYLETHAGRGFYDLKSANSEKTQEYKAGIATLWPHRKVLPDVFESYIKTCELFNTEERLRYYPGSPAIAIQLLREIDRLYCCELHPQEFNALSRLPKNQHRVHFAHIDGMTQLQALLPPPERRGLIFIDPSFEVKTEYRTIPQALQQAYQRFQTGVYGLWYPILDERLHAQWIRGLSAIKAPALQIEWSLRGQSVHAMQRCGVWIVNPPFCLHAQAQTVLTTLQQYFDSDVFLKAYS